MVAWRQRESTLGVELNQLGKKNVFVDRRIGESDPNMTAEAKQLRRFQRQKLLVHAMPPTNTSSRSSSQQQ